jgi:hypothetical protein
VLLIEQPQTTEELRGEPLLGEKSFAESAALWRDSSWRADLHGENCSIERFFEENGTPWRHSSRREELHGGVL